MERVHHFSPASWWESLHSAHPTVYVRPLDRLHPSRRLYLKRPAAAAEIPIITALGTNHYNIDNYSDYCSFWSFGQECFDVHQGRVWNTSMLLHTETHLWVTHFIH